MDLRLLSAFTTVMQEGSITQAANLLGLSQPAVSTQIGRLEADLGFALFTRTGNRVRPTAEALEFHAEAVRAMNVVDGLDRVAETIRSGATGNLVIAAHPSAGIALLPPALAAFREKRPEIRVQIITRNSDEIRALFPSRTHDIGIAEMPIDPSGLAVDRYEMDCLAILPEKHPLARHQVLTPELLHEEPFVIVSSKRATYHHIRSVFTERNARLNIIAEVEMFASICSLVACGYGLSIVDPASAEKFSRLGFIARRFEPKITYDVAVFRSADREPSVVTTAFLDILRNRLKRFCH